MWESVCGQYMQSPSSRQSVGARREFWKEKEEQERTLSSAGSHRRPLFSFLEAEPCGCLEEKQVHPLS